MAVDAPVPGNIAAFLDTPTPDAWLDEACNRLPEMLLDHANCELKAASTALGFLYRYPERTALAQRMSRLAREELRHFEQVRSIMDDMNVGFARLSASRYAGGLRDAVRHEEPYKLLDMLLVGALIEARSCERFAKIAPRLPERLGKFYGGLLASEARHFEHYIAFAKSECGIDENEVDARLEELKAIEASLITEPDDEFRFHSGSPR
ncbi:MAG TPA: tRNA isopentenyl-2-thiomethyl-A-37 hydroxylase MiaE [Woeseiaceae bacterium]|nr:tRNA isopentenyl-2-thiomethyl-A-37 hydroxylase MiaE [Woeseiaceae bacterium]